MITTADDLTVDEGDRVFDYYNGYWGTIQGIDADGWFDHVRDDGNSVPLNGERVAVVVPEGNPFYKQWFSGRACVVLTSATWSNASGDMEYVEERCGKSPVVGERGGFPMCEEHHAIFSPEDNDE